MIGMSNSWVASCDWFAYSCSCRGGHEPLHGAELLDDASGLIFKVESSPEHHPYYESSALLRSMSNGAPVCHLFFRCKRADNAFSCIVKVDNSRLYYPRWADATRAAIRALGWEIQHINRIDICIDFNYFANGRLPLRFVQDYLSKPSQTRSSFIRRGSNKFKAIGIRSFSNLNYETLSWGTRDSAVQTNLYNKSIELEERADKPWIRERWTQAGLLHGVFNGKRYYVWRVEFSINPSAVTWKSQDMKHVRELTIDDVSSASSLVESCSAFIPRYFQFYYLTTAAARNPKMRIRDLDPVVLFNDLDAVPYKPAPLRYYTKATRTDKMLLARLLSSLDSGELDEQETNAVVAVATWMENKMGLPHSTIVNNAANDTLSVYLRDCICTYDDSFRNKPIEALRKAKRWVRIMQGVRDYDTEKFIEALAKCEEIAGTDTFEQLMKYGNYVAASALPDEAIAADLDRELEEAAFMDYVNTCPSLNPQDTPQNAEDFTLNH